MPKRENPFIKAIAAAEADPSGKQLDLFLESEEFFDVSDVHEDAHGTYNPAFNPIVSQFHKDVVKYEVRGLMSPYGSGTSTTAVMDLLENYPLYAVAPTRKPSKDGIIRVKTKSAVLSYTFAHLSKSFMEAFIAIKPPQMKAHYHQQDRALKHSCLYKDVMVNGERRDVLVEGELMCIAMDRDGSDRIRQGLVCDVACVTEPGQIGEQFILALWGRTGRYNYNGAFNPGGLIVEGNPPQPTWELYHTIFGMPPGGPPKSAMGMPEPRVLGEKDKTAAGWGYEHTHMETSQHFRSKITFYPGADTEFANPKLVETGYYARMAKFPLRERAPFLYGVPYGVVEGTLAFPSFSPAIHVVSDEIQHRPGSRYVVTYDADNRAGATIRMLQPDGGWLWFDSTDCENRASDVFGREIAEMIMRNGIRSQNINFFCDPAGKRLLYGTRRPFFKSVQRVVESALGWKKTHRPLEADAQHPEARVDASEAILTARTQSGKPFVRIHEKCANLLHALQTYTLKEGPNISFNKDPKNPKAHTFGDCFTYDGIMLTREGGFSAGALAVASEYGDPYHQDPGVSLANRRRKSQTNPTAASANRFGMQPSPAVEFRRNP